MLLYLQSFLSCNLKSSKVTVERAGLYYSLYLFNYIIFRLLLF